MKPLIIYYSHGGNNELLAYRLQKELNCDIVAVETVGKRTGFSIFLDIVLARTPRIKPCSVDLGQYDFFIFIAPIWAGKIAAPLRSFLVRERSHLRDYAFITLCGGGMSEQAAKVYKELSTLLGGEPVAMKELWVMSLELPELKATPRKISSYSVRPEDIDHFSPDIQAFVEALRPEAVSST